MKTIEELESKLATLTELLVKDGKSLRLKYKNTNGWHSLEKYRNGVHEPDPSFASIDELIDEVEMYISIATESINKKA